MNEDNIQDLEKWLSDQRRFEAPSEFLLSDASVVRSTIEDAVKSLGREARSQRWYDSGLVRLRFSLAQMKVDAFPSYLTDLGKLIDRRSYRLKETNETRMLALTQFMATESETGRRISSSLLYELVSAVLGDSGEVSVNGPGGKITAAISERELLVDVMIRRRAQYIHGAWRSGSDILSSVYAALVGKEEIARCTFGYYEASLYRAQDALRLAYTFLVEMQGAEEAPRTRRILVEPATKHEELDMYQGLEEWKS